MKNKKTIAIAMSAMTVAGAVVPTFANEYYDGVIKDTVNVRSANGKYLELIPVHEQNLDEFLRANADKNPKKVGKVYSQSKAWYAIEMDMDLTKTGNKDLQKEAAIKLNKMKAELEDLKKETYEGKPRYNFEVREDKVRIEDTGYYQEGKTTVFVTDNKHGDAQVFSYVFMGACSFNENDVVDVQRETVDLATTPETVKDLDENYKNLAKYIYKLKQAKGKIYVTTSLGANGDVLTINVYRTDKKVLLGQITINSYDELNKTKLENYTIPTVNDFNGHWAEEDIIDGMQNGYVTLSSSFRPKENITRAEFAKIVCNVLESDLNDIKVEKEFRFSDVDIEDWYYGDVTTLAKKGIINGYADGTFKPNATITRQEAAVILASIKGIKEDKYLDINGKEIHKDTVTNFADDKSISTWADKSVNELSKIGIIKGYKEGNKEYFKPANKIQRVEALVMIQRAGK